MLVSMLGVEILSLPLPLPLPSLLLFLKTKQNKIIITIFCSKLLALLELEQLEQLGLEKPRHYGKVLSPTEYGVLQYTQSIGPNDA